MERAERLMPGGVNSPVRAFRAVGGHPLFIARALGSRVFDAVVNLFTSFGFFLLPRDDERVVAEWSRVLKPGGVLVWHGGNRDGVMRRFLSRDWWLADDHTMIGHERSFDALSGVLTVRSTWRGRRSAGEREHRIRLYSASHLAEMFARHGLVVEAAYDGWTDRAVTRRSGEMLLIARKDS